MFKFTKKPTFVKTISHLQRLENYKFDSIMREIGIYGVKSLSENTPIDTGETANSWRYAVKKTKYGYKISWSNDVMAGNVPLVILIQYGHGTKGGTYVYGKDFINPAMKPVKEALNIKLLEVLNG